MIPAALDWCESCGQGRRWWCPRCGFVFCDNARCRIHALPAEDGEPAGASGTICRACAR